MENYTKLVFLLASFGYWACNNQAEDIPNISDNLTENELLLTRTWKYDEVEADGATFNFADSRMEPGFQRADLGGNRADLFRRRIRYFPNKTYQLQWTERGDYQLGTENHPNWQPNYGYWTLEGNALIHNPGTFFETTYLVQISDFNFRRESMRYMSEARNSWGMGEEVLYIERFKIIENE